MAALMLAALLPTIAHCQVTDSTPQHWRLRVAWGGGSPVQWQVQAELDQGELGQLDLLGRQRDTPGSLWLTDGRLEGKQPRPRSFDGFDLTAHAPREAVLRIELKAKGSPNSHIIETTIDQLLTQQQRLSLDDSGNTLLVHRANDDALRIDLQHEQLIFAPDDLLRFMVEPVIASVPPGASLDLAVELIEGRSGRSLKSLSQRVALPARGSTPIPWSLPLPTESGVYTVTVTARHPPGNRVAFWGTASKQDALASRSFQVVVHDRTPVTRFANPEWTTLVEIDPANPRWWNRLPEWSRLGRLTGTASTPSGNHPFRTRDVNGTTFAELPPSGNGEAPWQAYPLVGARPGEPHLLEIALPCHAPLEIALRIYEEGEDGQLHPTDTERGAAVDCWVPPSKAGELVTHRMIFWPRTANPILVLQNAHSSQSSLYGPIRLRSTKATPVARETSAESSPHPVLARFSWEGLLARMAVGRNGPQGNPQIDDTLAIYEAANRLADFLELGGYNGALITVLADGGSACHATEYPLTPRLNSAPLASGTRDLPPIDPLQILLEVFSKRGLSLTPSLCFNHSLPPLEAELRDSNAASLVVADLSGRPRRLVGPDGLPGAPHYDFHGGLLERQVLSVVENILTRYGHHSALRGLAFELSADSYLVLPPLHFGLTPSKIHQFAKAIDASDEQRLAWREDPRTLLNDPRTRRQLMAWRAMETSRLWNQVAGRLTAWRADSSLLLLCDEMFSSRDYQGFVRPRMFGTPRLEELYLERGVDLQALAGIPQLEVPHVAIDTPAVPLNDAAIALNLNELASRAESFVQQGLVVAKRSRWMADPALNGGPVPEVHPLVFDRVGNAEFRLLVAGWRSTRGTIILGGQHGPSGDVVTSAALLKMAAQLASTQHADVASEQPLVAYLQRGTDQATVTVANPSPWPVTATVTLDVQQEASAQAITSAAPAKANYPRGKHAWPVTLPPFTLQGLQFDTAQVAIAGLRRSNSDVPTQMLQSRLAELERRDLAGRQLYEALANPSFEQLDSTGHPLSWRLVGEPAPAEGGRIATTPGFRDDHALRLQATQKTGATVVSDPFAAPPTGQLAMVVFVRPHDLASGSQLRLMLEEVGTNSSSRYIVSCDLPAERMLEDRKSQEWIGYRFGVEDLPLDSQVKLQVKLELVGQGDVAIDAIELYQVVFPMDLYPRDSEYQRLAIAQRLETARVALEQHRYCDCLQEVESYWAQFLLAYLPPEARPPEQVASPANSENQEAAPPKVGERLREWFRF